MRMRAFGFGALLALAACAGSDASATSLITFEQLADPTEDVSGATGIDLEEQTPEPTDICAAFDAAPSRWLQDALIPIQIWVGNFEAVDSPTSEVQTAVGELLDYGRARLKWNFTGGERPLWEDRHERAERTLTEWAVGNCELSPVIGPWVPGLPRGWADLSEEDVGRRCDGDEQRIHQAQEEYHSLTGSYAGHVIALETHLEIFYASDYFYVISAGPDDYQLAPVPEGACDFA